MDYNPKASYTRSVRPFHPGVRPASVLRLAHRTKLGVSCPNLLSGLLTIVCISVERPAAVTFIQTSTHERISDSIRTPELPDEHCKCRRRHHDRAVSRRCHPSSFEATDVFGDDQVAVKRPAAQADWPDSFPSVRFGCDFFHANGQRGLVAGRARTCQVIDGTRWDYPTQNDQRAPKGARCVLAKAEQQGCSCDGEAERPDSGASCQEA